MVVVVAVVMVVVAVVLIVTAVIVVSVMARVIVFFRGAINRVSPVTVPAAGGRIRVVGKRTGTDPRFCAFGSASTDPCLVDPGTERPSLFRTQAAR